MGNKQSQIDELQTEVTNVYSDKRRAQEESGRLRRKIEDKEKEWEEFLKNERKNNDILQAKLKEERLLRTNELKKLKDEVEKEKMEDQKREQKRLQEEEKREAEYKEQLRQLLLNAQDSEAKFEESKKAMEKERDEELRKLEEARRQNDKESEKRYKNMLSDIQKKADDQRRQAEEARCAAERERIRIENERKKIQEIEENRIKEERRKEAEEKARLLEEERKKAEEMEIARAKAAEEDMKKQIQELRQELQELKPGDSFEFPPDHIHFPEKYNIGLFGTTGIGKSSLLNSLKFAFKGSLDELSQEQTSTDTFQGGNTVRRLEVQVTRHLVFIDNRGVGAEDLELINAGEEIISQLEGRAGFGRQVDWRGSDGGKGRLARRERRIYCTILVFDAQNPQAVYSVLPKLVQQIFKWQGRFPIGVLTHVDNASANDLENMHVVVKAAGIVDTYEIANITGTRRELSLKHQLNLLRLMRLCIKQGDSVFKLREEIESEEAEDREIEEERVRKLRVEKEQVRAKEEEIKKANEEEKNAELMREVEKVKLSMAAEQLKKEKEIIMMKQEIEKARMALKAEEGRKAEEEARAKMRTQLQEEIRAEIEKNRLQMMQLHEEKRKVNGEEGRKENMTTQIDGNENRATYEEKEYAVKGERNVKNMEQGSNASEGDNEKGDERGDKKEQEKKDENILREEFMAKIRREMETKMKIELEKEKIKMAKEMEARIVKEEFKETNLKDSSASKIEQLRKKFEN